MKTESVENIALKDGEVTMTNEKLGRAIELRNGIEYRKTEAHRIRSILDIPETYCYCAEITVKDITAEIDVTKDLLHVLRSELENLETEIADMEGEFSVL